MAPQKCQGALSLVALSHPGPSPEPISQWDSIEGAEERYDIEAVSSPSGVTHLTFTRR